MSLYSFRLGGVPGREASSVVVLYIRSMWLTKHAKERMKERSISVAQIRSVLRSTQTQFMFGGKPGVTIGKGTVDGKILTVIVGTGTENVITAYWSKTKRGAK